MVLRIANVGIMKGFSLFVLIGVHTAAIKERCCALFFLILLSLTLSLSLWNERANKRTNERTNKEQTEY
jgi:hypothetical protein